jgi:hypothetical protein
MCRIMFKASLCAKWVSMINADLMAISHVIGSLQLARIFHEAVTFTIREALARDVWRVMKM